MTVAERIEFLLLQRSLSEMTCVETVMLSYWDRLDELWRESLGEEVEYEREPVRLWFRDAQQ